MSAPRTFFYVANAESHDISVFLLDDAGDLDVIERFPVGGSVMPLAVGAGGHVLHASIRSEPFRVASLRIDAASGRLSLLADTPLPASMCWISTDASGRFLFAASYGGSLISVSPVRPDGTVGEATQVVPTEANAHSLRVDPSNRFAFAACLGGGVLRQFRFDVDTGRLVDNEPRAWAARPGAGPRHIAFHPAAPFAYLVHELDASVDVLAFDRQAGTMTTVQTVSAWPAGATGEPWAADLHLTPDGRFLYASERRSGTLAGFAVGAAGGSLTPLGSTPTEAEPRGFAISLDGRFLFAAGQASHRIARFAIDAGSGALRRLGTTPCGRGPNWIVPVELTGVAD